MTTTNTIPRSTSGSWTNASTGFAAPRNSPPTRRSTRQARPDQDSVRRISSWAGMPCS